MLIAILSDIHGNLPALEMTLSRTQHVEAYICLGDTVNYGPWSNECVELIHTLPNLIYIQGNHEQYFIDGHYDGENIVAKTFFNLCFPKFNNFDIIKNLPKTYELNDFTFCHTILNKNIYPDTSLVLDGNYVIGHSHHQFEISQPPFKLINSGSVGQNRKYINIINYLLLDTESMKFELKKISYDESVIIKEMKAKKYPEICIKYYNDKLRLK